MTTAMNAKDEPACRQHEEQKRADAGKEDGYIGIEAHQQGRDDGRAGHCKQVLHAHRNGGGGRKTLVRKHDGV